MNPILRAENLSCEWALRGGELSHVEDVSLAIDPKTLNVLRGPAGSGRNLLLRLLGLLETPDAGEVFVRGAPTRMLDAQARAAIRNRYFGFMFAEPFLLPSLSVVENIAMPMLKNSTASTDEARVQTLALLDFAGLSEAGEMRVDELSLAGQHRVSLARALVNRPEILIAGDVDADMETSELESLSALLRDCVERFEVTVIFCAAEVKVDGAREIEISGGMIARDVAAAARCHAPR